MKEYFEKLISFNHWANSRLLGFLETHNVKEEQIQKLLSHILNAEYIWLFRMMEKGDPGKKVWDVHSMGLLSQMTNEVNSLYVEWLNAFDEKDFGRIINYLTSQGTPFSTSVEDILSHMINHGSYHRGQINQLLRKRGIDPPMLDYIIFRRN